MKKIKDEQNWQTTNKPQFGEDTKMEPKYRSRFGLQKQNKTQIESKWISMFQHYQNPTILHNQWCFTNQSISCNQLKEKMEASKNVISVSMTFFSSLFIYIFWPCLLFFKFDFFFTFYLVSIRSQW